MTDVGRTKKVERLNRGLSNDLLIRLENAGLTPGLARRVVEGDQALARAMVQAIHAATDTDFGLVEKWDPKRLEEEGPVQLQRQFEGWYSRRGFLIIVPRPHVTPAEIILRCILGYGAFYLPPLTPAFDIDKLALVSGKVRFDRMDWPRENTGQRHGYWFWGEVMPGPLPAHRCRRSQRGTLGVTPASIEEYVILWLHEHDECVLDQSPECVLLRNKSHAGHPAMIAESRDGRLEISGLVRGSAVENIRATDRIPDAA